MPPSIVVVPVQAGKPERRDVLPLFLLPPAGNETAGLRRLGKALGEEWPVSLVCPPLHWYDATCYPIEDAANASAVVIREARPKAPFVVGGFCRGGVIAAETARLLQHEGCAGLLLFDTPVPGYPKLTPGSLRAGALGRFIRVLRQQWAQANGKRLVYRFILKRIAWYSMLVLRPLLAPMWRQRWVNDVLHGDTIANTPFFWRRRLDLPILHFLADAVDYGPFREAARLDWEPVAQQGVTYRFVPGGHNLIFSRPNLPSLAEEIRKWRQSLFKVC
jgi:thioesterase domain-containing protein